MLEPLVLIFAYHYPPQNTIGAARPYRLSKYLSRLGYRCRVFTAADVREFPHLDAEYVPDPFLLNSKAGIGYQIERLIRKLALPGVTGTQWAFHAHRAALRYLERNSHGPVIVFSTFPPLGSHLAGYWFSQRKRLPWIADQRDPVADNPGVPEVNGLTRPTYRKLEKIFVHAASVVIANTDAAADKLRATYPDCAGRVQLIWNGFDPEQRLEPLPHAPGARRILAHVGDLYGGRSLSPILESVRRLLDQSRLGSPDFQFTQLGELVPSSIPDAAFVAQAETEGWLKIAGGRVSQSQAHEVIRTAHGLLLIQPQSALQVPGKLFEYLQMGRPILAFVPANSPVERILARSGVPYVCAYSGSTADEMDAAVLKFVGMNDAECRPNSWFESEFNAENHAEKVAHMIDGLTRQPSSKELSPILHK